VSISKNISKKAVVTIFERDIVFQSLYGTNIKLDEKEVFRFFYKIHEQHHDLIFYKLLSLQT